MLQAASGNEAVFASTEKGIQVPVMMQVKKSDATGEGATTDITVTLTTDEQSTVSVCNMYGDGSIGAALVPVTDFSVSSTGIKIQNSAFDTDGDAVAFFVSYKKTVTENAAKITNSAKDFPNTVRMLLKVAYYDPCEKDSIKACYVEIPNFMVSPETELSLSSDSATMDISATLEMDYCDADKELYSIYFYDDEEDL